jgi:hypothetical protein
MYMQHAVSGIFGVLIFPTTNPSTLFQTHPPTHPPTHLPAPIHPPTRATYPSTHPSIPPTPSRTLKVDGLDSAAAEARGVGDGFNMPQVGTEEVRTGVERAAST